MAPNLTVPTGPSASPQTRSGTNPPRRILLVEDDDAIRHLSTEVLISFGYDVDTAEDGAAAWDTLQRNSYDLLVTDNHMPKVSGLELLQKLRDFCITTPVIMATGTSPDLEFTRRPWLQPAATLLKPFTPEELLEAVEGVLKAMGNGHEPIEPGTSGSSPS